MRDCEESRCFSLHRGWRVPHQEGRILLQSRDTHMENQRVLKSRGSGLAQQHRDRWTLMEHPVNPCQAPCPQCARLMVACFVCVTLSSPPCTFCKSNQLNVRAKATFINGISAEIQPFLKKKKYSFKPKSPKQT